MDSRGQPSITTFNSGVGGLPPELLGVLDQGPFSAMISESRARFPNRCDQMLRPASGGDVFQSPVSKGIAASVSKRQERCPAS